jgi:ADP-ribose pyrophosphatase YjhB (NUDIX family)
VSPRRPQLRARRRQEARSASKEREPGPERPWLQWAREIQSLAQTAHHYAQNEYDRARAERLLEIAAEILSSRSRLRVDEALVAFTAQPGYGTPKVDVRGVVVDDGKVLMVREAADDCWTFPGGWADVGETPRQATEREVFEEAGVRARARRLVGVYDANRVEGSLSVFHAYKLVFLCDPTGGSPAVSSETSEVGWFPIDSLPQPLSPFRTTPRHIRDVLEALRDPERPTAFD